LLGACHPSSLLDKNWHVRSKNELQRMFKQIAISQPNV
jgi:hypothetical protein